MLATLLLSVVTLLAQATQTGFTPPHALPMSDTRDPACANLNMPAFRARVTFTVDARGVPAKIKLHDVPARARACIQHSTERMRFEPARRDGVAVEQTMDVTMHINFTDDAKQDAPVAGVE